MMLPSGPTPYCIIAHPQQLLAVFTARVDGPPHPAHPPECFQRGVHWGIAQGSLQLARLPVPPPHQPDLRPRHGVPHGDYPQCGTLRHHGPLAAFLYRLACPRLGGQRRRHLHHRPRLWGALHQALPVRSTSASTPRRDGCRRALFPDPRGVGHFSTIPPAQPSHALQKARVAPKRLVRHHPTTPHRLALEHRGEHLLGQRGLGFAGEVGRKTALPAPLRIRVVCEPFRRHLQPTLQHGVAVGTARAHQHAGLAVGPLPQFPTVLPLHTNRMAALLRNITPIDPHYPIVGTQVRFHYFPVPVHQLCLVPLPFTDKGLHGPDRLGGDTVYGQHHGLDRLARHRRQQPLERGVCRLALFTPLKQGAVNGVIGAQCLHQQLHILDRHIHLWRRLDQVDHTALLPRRGDGQHYITFRSLVVVVGGKYRAD